MARLAARMGIGAMIAFGIVALFVPDLVPKAGPPYDKVLHFSFFMVAALLAGFSVEGLAGAMIFGAVLILGGMLVEVVQGASGGGRTAELMDAVVNAAGAGCGVLIVFLLKRGGGSAEEAADANPSSRMIRTVRAAYLDARSRGATDKECLRAAVLAYQHFRPEDDEPKARREIVRMLENID
ncbi:MAG: hypothetical protein RIC36_19080 [Rhodospirillales bacterium]